MIEYSSWDTATRGASIIAHLLALWPKSGLKARGERAAQHKLGGVGTSGSHAGTF